MVARFRNIDNDTPLILPPDLRDRVPRIIWRTLFFVLDAVEEMDLRQVRVNDVTLRGHSLRRIETVMQRMELSYLAALPSNQQSLVPDGQPIVIEVVVCRSEMDETPFSR